jgi:hypothetical protein
MVLELRKPDGTIIDLNTMPYTFVDWADSAHLGWRIESPDNGEWEMLVYYVVPGDSALAPTAGEPIPYRVLAGGRTNLTVELLLPDRLGKSYTTGQRLPIYALVASDEPLSDATVMATVTSPFGSELTLPLYDDGTHDDGAKGDGIYGNWYTAVNQAVVETPGDEGVPEPPANDEGGYQVRVVVSGPTYQREARGAFSVLEGEDENGNGLPDPFEDENGVNDPFDDPDLDGLTNFREYELGTDPNNADTDFGGENDGSEVNYAQNPLDPADDQVNAPDYFRVTPADNAAVLYFGAAPGHLMMALYTAPAAGGPWTLFDPDIGLTSPYTCTLPCAANGETVYMQIVARAAGGRNSALLRSEGITPSSDPIPPDAIVIINDHAVSTHKLQVMLDFASSQEEPEAFDDIVDVMLSNSPHFEGAAWQPFAQGIPWTLDEVDPGDPAKVYARFRDAAGNESSGVSVGTIFYLPPTLRLPILMKP